MRIGELIDNRFVIEARIGSGGMGAVFRAHDRVTGQAVALKALHDPEGGDAFRFAREARILAELEHPHVVRYVAHGFAPQGEPYLAMEWLEGVDLGARLSRGGLTLEETLDLGHKVAGALDAAHALGIVHRDIKPSNLFLVNGEVSAVKVLDFGIARQYGASASLTRTGGILGTPGYMAPEQAQGNRVIGPPADIFSLGAVLFECISGKPAFQGAHMMALLAKLLLEDPPLLVEVRPDVPKDVSELCARMLAKDPAARPADGAALVALIEAIASGSGLPAISRQVRAASPISATERRLLSILAIAPLPEEPSDAFDRTLPAGDGRHNVISVVRPAVEPFGGRAEALANGMILVVLQGPGTPTDQAGQAARCGLRIRALLPGAAIALVTGRAEATQRSLVGEIVERAATLLGRAGAQGNGGRIALDAVTRALLEPRFVVEGDGDDLYLLEDRPIDETARTLLGKPSPYVGRQRELRNLLDHIQDSFEERKASALLVIGAPGMGKSRLRSELTKQLLELRPEVGMGIGRGDSVGAGSAFAMIAGVFRSSLHIPIGEAIELQREKLCRAVDMVIAPEHRRRVAEFLGELIGAPFPAEGSPRLRSALQNASIMTEQIQSAYIDFMGAVADAQPVLLVLEDLHWGDVPSIKLVDAALRELRDKPFVVLALARPEVHETFPRLWSARVLNEVRLSGLARRAAESLVRSALGEGIDPATVEDLVDRADGNAFYLEELIRAVAEGRSEGMPETVLGMVEARLHALPVELRRWLRAASIFGQTFWWRGVGALLGENATSAAAEERLSDLTEREIITSRSARRFAGEVEHVFRHALLREASYAMLTERDRKLGHKTAADWLLTVGEQDSKVIAEHFELGGEPARAAEFYVRAAEQALRGGDSEAVITLSSRGVALGAEPDVAAALWAVQAESAFWMQKHELASKAAEEAMRLATPGSKSDCRALSAAVCSALMSERPEALMGPMQRMLVIEPEPGAAPSMIWGFYGCILALMLGGLRELAERYLQRMIEIAGTDPDPYSRGWIFSTQAYWARWVDADYWSSFKFSMEAATCFEQAGDGRYLVGARIHSGLDLAHLGAFTRAEEVLLDGLRHAQEGTEAWSARFYLAQLYLAMGEFEKAVALAESSEQEVTKRGSSGRNDRMIVAEANLRLGRTKEAEAEARAIHAARATMPYFDFPPFALLCEAELALGHLEEALSLSEAWLARSRALGMIESSIPRVHLVRVEALRALGRVDETKTALREAKDSILTLAAKIGDPELRRCFLENHHPHARTFALCRELDL